MSQISKSAQNLIINGSLITVTAACTTALWSGDSLLPDSLLVGFGIAAGGMLVARFPRRRSRSRWAQVASVVRTQSSDPDIQSFRMKWKPGKMPDEFVFDGLGLPVPISESKFLRFLTIACRRQINARYGGCTLGLQKRIRMNWVLSEGHFTKRTRPRLTKPEFNSALMVLGYARLLVKPVQGSSGYLLGDYEALRCLEIAKNKWIKWTASPPRRSLWNGLFNYDKNNFR